MEPTRLPITMQTLSTRRLPASLLVPSVVSLRRFGALPRRMWCSFVDCVLATLVRGEHLFGVWIDGRRRAPDGGGT
jgi:hypothetical protein